MLPLSVLAIAGIPEREGFEVVIVKLDNLPDDRGWLLSTTTLCPGFGKARS
jgi:hypothetical protein